MTESEVVIFDPLPGPQTELLTVPVRDILFGGARGGGKSYGVLGHFAAKAIRTVSVYGKRNCFHGILMRRTYPELEDIIKRAKEMFGGVGEWKEGKKTFIFPVEGIFGGATLKFRHLEKDDDATKYQGHEYQWVCIEEAGNFPSPKPVYMLRATLRSAEGVPTYFLLTANPGGVGHNWLKSDYVDPSPPSVPFKVKLEGSIKEVYRIFIPSKLSDNPILMEANDGEYLQNLLFAVAGNEQLRRAWLDGDWNVIAGGMFDDVWSDFHHILEPFAIPGNWPITRAYDWGSSAPFSIGWWATTDDSLITLPDRSVRQFAHGTLIRIHEWYGCSKNHHNQGLRLVEEEIINGIKEIEQTEGIHCNQAGPADTNIFEIKDGTALADKHHKHGIYWKQAVKHPGSRITGWQHIRQRLVSSKEDYPEHPGLFVFNTCRDFIRTVPVLQRAKKNIEDVNTESEDHIADETRYMVMHVPAVTGISKLTGY